MILFGKIRRWLVETREKMEGNMPLAIESNNKFMPTGGFPYV